MLTRLAFWFAFPFFIAYSLVTGQHRKSLKQRLGLYDRSQLTGTDSLVVWFHAASVGEVKAARILIEKLKAASPRAKIVLTTVTAQGLAVAGKEIGTRATCLYAPLDFPGAVRRAAEAINPSVYVCLETELWPNLLKELQKRNVKMFLLNARISERSSHRYHSFRNLVGELLSGFSGIGAITDKDADRLLKLGADKETLFVSGNVKYDQPGSSDPAKDRNHYLNILDLGDEHTVLVAGSTHSGEEDILVSVFEKLRQKLNNAVLIIAPRHLSRLPDITRQLSDSGTSHDLLSEVRNNGRACDIVLVDTMGELASLYSVADYIFCGGSLVERGGHNLLEAARWAVPVFYGPSMKDFADAEMILGENGGGIRVKSATELADRIMELAGDQKRYNRVAECAGYAARRQHGAAEKQLAPILKTLRAMESCPG